MLDKSKEIVDWGDGGGGARGLERKQEKKERGGAKQPHL